MAEEEKEIQEIEKPNILTGFNRVLEILANKISKKAALIAVAMILVYLLANYLFTIIATVTVTNVLTVMGIICGLAIFGVMLQFIIDYMNASNKRKAMEKKKEEAPEVNE